MISETEKDFFSKYKLELKDALIYIGWEKYPETEEEFIKADSEAVAAWSKFYNQSKDDHGRISLLDPEDLRKLRHLERLRIQVYNDLQKIIHPE